MTTQTRFAVAALLILVAVIVGVLVGDGGGAWADCQTVVRDHTQKLPFCR